MSEIDTPGFSVVIPNYNGLVYLRDCFNSLRKSNYPNLEIIMVDNGSTDESVTFVEQNYPEVMIIRSETNLSYSGGSNLGIQHATGEYVVLLNNDTEVTTGWLDPLLEEFQSNSQLAACQPKILSMSDHTMFEYAGAAGGFMDPLGYPFLRGRIFDTLEKDEGQYDDSIDLFWTSGAAMAIRKQVLDESGLLDEDFVLHMEEIDLCWRMHLLGHQLSIRPDAVIYHHGGGTLGAEKMSKMYYNHRNSVFMLFKNYSLKRLLLVFPIRFLLDMTLIVKSALALDWKRALAVIKAYLWLITHPRLILRKRRAIQKLRRTSDRDIDPYLLNGSLVLRYYLLRKKTFTEMWPAPDRI
ncbi:glycosyltransferase family 2 protein [Candidatus Neomarinimicrobiota bacterium]